MGISLKDYITEIIVSRASRLLSYTDKTILEIADILGFEDPSYFHRVFKKNTGLTPKEYRKNSQEQPDYHELNKFK
jgi:AraC-like DNA-binding protein